MPTFILGSLFLDLLQTSFQLRIESNAKNYPEATYSFSNMPFSSISRPDKSGRSGSTVNSSCSEFVKKEGD